jgi:hypothetical protein
VDSKADRFGRIEEEVDDNGGLKEGYLGVSESSGCYGVGYGLVGGRGKVKRRWRDIGESVRRDGYP